MANSNQMQLIWNCLIVENKTVQRNVRKIITTLRSSLKDARSYYLAFILLVLETEGHIL